MDIAQTMSSWWQAVRDRTEPIEWPNDEGVDVFEFVEEVEQGPVRLNSSTFIDLSEQSAETSGSGTYTFGVDRSGEVWNFQTGLDLNGSDGGKLNMFSEIEMDLTPGARAISASLHISSRSDGRDASDTPSGPVSFSTGFDFDYL
ncbi:hypothetical protein OCH239_18765 [Roseivivax halodurans JCM 10272]|uniref:Uncharacterized protein n=1 Tax=Roseivivax halodurans JCM 10272 TaxID=1449350 RepID=X7E838_9RHOB|nr:hypothetical protein [Roseivivax halodurans]ETX11995.1 hypothetical protein OCH239_18765 [Roseivivax halodurans JCM 10272]